jgi:DNA mismatch repair protein MutS
LKQRVENRQSARLQSICAALDDVPEAREPILAAIADEPPVNLTDGGAIRPATTPISTRLRDSSRNGKQYIAQIEARERERTGIQSLKVRFNKVFGYYIEILQSQLHNAPPITSASRRWSTPNATPRPN